MIKKLCFFLLAISLSIPSFAQKKGDPVGTDIAKTIPAPYEYQQNAKYNGMKLQTYYVEMRDGVKLAVDVYRPKKLGTDKLPVLIHQTRYWRSPELRWPFKWFTNGIVGRMGNMIKDIVDNGYIIVNVDARGSGASFGNRPHPWTKEETLDGADIIDWVLEQEWSNGNIGSLGVSYSGTTAEFLSFNQHPNLKAVILMYSLFDVYDDIAYPGGIFQKHFVNDWGYYNSRLDEDKLPRSGFVEKLLVKGVKRVRGGARVRTFKSALVDHEANLQVNKTARGLEFRDQKPSNVAIDNADVFSPFTYMDELNESGVAVYSYSGWMDGDYQHAAIRRHLNLDNPHNKLILGPWEHSGKYNCSPAAPSLSGFDHTAEILKFFDYHLKGKQNGLTEEASVHYFTMVEDEWKQADSWPPEMGYHDFYLFDEQQLTETVPEIPLSYDIYQVDTNVETSTDSRWYSVIGKLKTPDVYPGRKEQTEQLLYYDTAPMAADMEISGHPIMQLHLSSDQPDGNVHVYLDDVAPDGSVKYITEGLLRIIHRAINETEITYEDVPSVPLRNYSQKDKLPLEQDEIAELKFDILPTSYLIKEGHKLRLSIAGADQIHFSVMHKAEPVYKIFRGGEHASFISIPMQEKLGSEARR